MRTTLPLLLLAAFAAGPLSAAHAPSPKTGCETWLSDTSVHDYLGVGPSLIPGGGVLSGVDGSGGQDCAGASGEVVSYCLDEECVQGCQPSLPWIKVVFCASPAGADGHHEFALGGALLLAEDPPAGRCWGEPAHHPPFGVVTVLDVEVPDASFTVAVDALDNVSPVGPLFESCGDGEEDFALACVSSCSVPFPPGLDGAYRVHVAGVAGHVWTA